MMTLGERLHFLRMQKGLSLDKLARQTGISKSFLADVEHDRSKISSDKLVLIADALKISLEALARGTPEPEDYQPPMEKVPDALAALAWECNIPYPHVLTLLDFDRSIRYRRSTRKRASRSKEEWRKLYEAMKPVLEEVE